MKISVLWMKENLSLFYFNNNNNISKKLNSNSIHCQKTRERFFFGGFAHVAWTDRRRMDHSFSIEERIFLNLLFLAQVIAYI